jgi:hypothetical protein
MKERQLTPVWLWMNLLSLDAPLVAVVWQDFLARVYPSVLRPAGRWALGLTVWAIYLADRLLDVRLPTSAEETIPHQFYRRNSQLARRALAVALSVDLSIGFLWLRHAVFANGLVIGAGVITYLGAFPVGQFATRWKPMAAAILFTSGVFVVAWTGTTKPERSLGWLAAAFCMLCLANLVLIGCWEQGKTSDSTGIWILLLVMVCAFFGASKWYAAVALSGAGLSALAFWGNRLSPAARRALADAVLLSPLLFL